MSWTQKELEELYRKANEKGKKDPDFCKKLETDARGALEELAGKSLPEGFQLKMVDGDSKYASAYMVPDFSGNELDLSALRSVAGGEGEEDYGDSSCPSAEGVSAALIVSVCGVAVDVGPCAGDVCGGNIGCAGNVCTGAVCGGDVGCGGNVCTGEVAGASGGCGGALCSGDTAGATGGCLDNMCTGQGDGATGGCGGNECVGQAAGANGGCGGNMCEGYACGADGPCGGDLCGDYVSGN